MQFHDRLKKLMDAREITPRDLARLCPEISLAWIYKALSGEVKNVGIETVGSVAKALGVEPADLLYSSFGKALHNYGKTIDRAVDAKIEKEGYMKPDNDAKELLEAFETMDEPLREILLNTAKQYAKVNKRGKTQKKIS